MANRLEPLMTRFSLNGSDRTVASDRETPLLYVLRDELRVLSARTR